MTTLPKTVSQTPDWSTELDEKLRELQAQVLVAVLVGLGVLGVLLLRAPQQMLPAGQNLIAVFMIFALICLVVWISRKHYEIAAWILLVGSLGLWLRLVAWSRYAPMVFLLIVPAVIATLLISIPAGLTTALGLSLLLILQPAPLPALETSVQFLALSVLWITVGALSITLKPLLETTQWAWQGYQRSQVSLDQARDYQQQLAATLEDLREANAQLTHLNRLAQALRRAAEDERRIKEQFVANVSHELRTPLNMVIGFCEMIMESPETYGETLPPTLLADLDIVFRNSQHLSSLIDDVLDLSQIEAGQMALVREYVVFHEIVASAITAVRPLYRSKALDLEASIPDDLPLVFCDRTRIREVLLNLLSNAGRFTEKGGVIISARQDNNHLIVSVTDTGPGISEHDQARIFKPFEQLDGTIRRRYGGTGLGLSISRSFVELHEGKMWVESRPGRGTTFSFSLPTTTRPPQDETYMRWIDPYQRHQVRSRPRHAVHVQVKPRWLVVEKGDAMLRLLTRHVDGINLVAARTLEEARASLTETPSQALLINALDVGAALQTLQEGANLPYGMPVILTSVPGVEQATSGLGVADYLVKPISRGQLLAALDRLEQHVKTVLIIDDEQEALMLFRRMLSSAGQDYRVLRARHGRQALHILKRERPDVILLDLTMPEMDGFEFLKVRQGKPWQDVPVILISARDPLGHPIVSNALAVTAGSGLSVNQILTSVKMLTGTLAPALDEAST